MKLRVQDVEHGLKLQQAQQQKKQAEDGMASPRTDRAGTSVGAGASLAEVAAGGTLLSDGSLRSLYAQVESVQNRCEDLSVRFSTLDSTQASLSHRAEELEQDVSELRSEMAARALHVDEALRQRVEVASFERYRREQHAENQAQHHAVLSTAQAALAAANLAQLNASGGGGASTSSANSGSSSVAPNDSGKSALPATTTAAQASHAPSLEELGAAIKQLSPTSTNAQSHSASV